MLETARSSRSRISLALTALFLLLVLGVASACGRPVETRSSGEEAPAAPEAEVLRYNLGAEPETLDSALATGNPEFTTLYQLFEGLTRLDAHYQPVPGVAERWEISPDGTVYTFHLRHDAAWSNGDPVTAHDFVYAWRRVLDPDTASQYAYQLYYLKNAADYNNRIEDDPERVGVTAVDDYTLRVALEAPTPQFLALTAFPTYFPVHREAVAAAAAYGASAEGLISNGPFRLERWEHRQRLVMVPNPHYWDADAVRLDQLVFFTVGEASTELGMFEAGEIDLGDNPPASEIERLRREGLAAIGDDLATYYYLLNTEREPFDDPRVRRAFALAVDREALVRVLNRGELPARAFVPPGIPDPATGRDFREEGGDAIRFDPDEARRLLAEAGYPGGAGLPPIEILFNEEGDHDVIAQFVQEQWRQHLGVTDVRLVHYEWGVYQERRQQGLFQVARAGWGADYIDPTTFLDLWTSHSGNNDTGWGSEEYDRLLAEAKRLESPEARFERLHQAEAILMRELPLIPLYFYTDPYIAQPYVKGAIRFPFGPDWDFRAAYIER